MLDKEQRNKIAELFSDGVSISEIARKVGVSRYSVYRVIDSDVKRDPMIRDLEKELKQEELMKKIKDLRGVTDSESELKSELYDLRNSVDDLFSKVLTLFYWSHGVECEPQHCIHCGKRLTYVEGEKSGRGYRCDHCHKFFRFV